MTTTIGSSLPSLPVALSDAPEVTSLTAEFVYNFYKKDELTDDTVATTAPPNTVAFSRKAPRFVKLTWNKVNTSSRATRQQNFVDISIAANAGRVLEEEDLSLAFFGSFHQQETSFVVERQKYLSKLYEQLNYNTQNASLTDAARALNEITPDSVTQEFIQRYCSYAHSEGTNTSYIPPNPATEAQSIRTVIPVANSVYGTLFHEKLVNDALLPITLEMTDGLTSLFNTQHSVRPYLNRFSGGQYDLSLDNPVDVVISETQADAGFTFQSTGYIIERYQETAGGGYADKRTFFVESPDTTEYFDTQVLYNQRYTYGIKAVVAIQALSYDPEQKVNAISTFLVASKILRTNVMCEDITPSEPPTDFFVSWDYGKKKPVLTWNFPNDTRRHIKYFQVFRRQNVGNMRPVQLPFELVRMYDFNDLQGANGTFFNAPAYGEPGVFMFTNGEQNIDARLVVNQSNSQTQETYTPTCYIDEEFDREKYYIYTVAAIDAHGVTTNYTNQVGISFNKQRNTIERVDISAPGAPKPYPNLYLNRDTFVDTIKTEGYSQVTVVFNPEYFDINRVNGENIKLLQFGPDNKYRLQMINTDLQTDQFVDIRITDERNPV